MTLIEDGGTQRCVVGKLRWRSLRFAAWVASVAVVFTFGGTGSVPFAQQPVADTDHAADPTTTATQADVNRWIAQLASSKFHEREEAARRLHQAGTAAVPALTEAAGSTDREVARRARGVLRTIVNRQELKKLEGWWSCLSLRHSGVPINPAGARVLVQANRMLFQGSPLSGQRSFLIDATETPKHFDWTWDDYSQRGIYALDGDRLTLCFPESLDAARPRTIQDGPGLCVYILMREPNPPQHMK